MDEFLALLKLTTIHVKKMVIHRGHKAYKKDQQRRRYWGMDQEESVEDPEDYDTEEEFDTDEDEYDLNDPFINDGETEDYAESSEEEETSFELYRLLELQKEATQDQVKISYRRLALIWHPDKNKSPEAEQRMKQINKAYQVLSDKKKRKEYGEFLINFY